MNRHSTLSSALEKSMFTKRKQHQNSCEHKSKTEKVLPLLAKIKRHRYVKENILLSKH